MSDSPERIPELRMWVSKAEGDLAAAELLLSGTETLAWAAGFHAQQCVEKYLKALLVALSVPFPKAHDNRELVALLPVEQQPSIAPALAADLTDYAVWSRYPGSPEPTPDEVREGIRVAHAVRDWVRARLPSAVLRP
jgi:HEPN domain-containing protein